MSSITTVLLLGHQAQVGKDTLASELILHENFQRLAFADKLKTLSQDLFNLSHDQVHNNDYKNVVDSRFIMTPRQILQKVGKDMREIDADVWAKNIFTSEIPKYQAHGIYNYVVTDCRFPNEIVVAKTWQAENPSRRRVYTIKIVREREEQSFAGSNDISETALSSYTNWDLVLENNGTISDLYNSFVTRFWNQHKVNHIPATGPF